MMALFILIPAVVFTGLLLIASVVGTILYLAGPPRSGVKRVGGSIGMVCGSLLLVLLVAGGLMVVGVSPRQVVLHDEHRPRPIELKNMSDHAPEHGHSPMVVSPQPATVSPAGQVAEQMPNADAGLTRLTDDHPAESPIDAAKPSTGLNDAVSATRPSWTNSGQIVHGDVAQQVLSSKQYATIDEARAEVAAEARKILSRDFEKIYRAPRESLQHLPNELIQSSAVRAEYVETVDRDFGSFRAPMHRVWWQLELSPDVRTKLHPVWKAQVQEFRTLTVGGTLLAVTVGLAGLSLFTRRRHGVMG